MEKIEVVELYKPRQRRKKASRPRKWGIKVHKHYDLKKVRKAGKKSLSKYKKEFDAIFSKYIRQIHPARCYTCDALKHRKKLQNGHFVLRQYLATRWEEDNCRPQCFGCNIRGKGMVLEFEERLIKELGAARVQELKDSRKILMKLDEAFYLRKISEYKEKVDKLNAEG